MGSVNDSVLDLERYRSKLETNVTKLRTSLRHWQMWEAEYEGMKEEIAGLGEKHSDRDLVCLLLPCSGGLIYVDYVVGTGPCWP